MPKALNTAVRLEEEGKYTLAAHAYREVLADRPPKSVLAWTNLGNSEMRLGAARRRRGVPQGAGARRPIGRHAEQSRVAPLRGEALEEAEPLARKAVITPAPDPWLRLDTLARILARAARARGGNYVPCRRSRRCRGSAGSERAFRRRHLRLRGWHVKHLVIPDVDQG